uniref:Uncharacterized protein n=1 Tax=Strombidium rassoulzadegani TaxID=1082188 RepID=A0A7S3FUY6_9SPIT|mmetsp:Transcript_1008/g.1815  ORF Transcript_1008/g.1815 Transcript_1008/m.1815 type:complete len:116 (+) Transcript_1008:47-394(+)
MSVDPYDPKSYYLADTAASIYKDYYTSNTLLESINMPLPNIASFSTLSETSFEYWSALMEWQPLKALAVISFTGIVSTTLAVIFFYFRTENINGFVGFDYSQDYDPDELISSLTW